MAILAFYLGDGQMEAEGVPAYTPLPDLSYHTTLPKARRNVRPTAPHYSRLTAPLITHPTDCHAVPQSTRSTDSNNARPTAPHNARPNSSS